MNAVLHLISSLKQKFVRWRANRSNEAKRSYFREQGMKVGEKTRFTGFPACTEPYLVEIGRDCLISDGVYFHTHDGSVKDFTL